MRQPTNRETIGMFYILIVFSYLNQLPIVFSKWSWMSLQTAGINIIHISGFAFFLTAGYYMLTNTPRLIPVVQKSEYFWYSTAVGFLIYGVGYFLGDGPYLASNMWAAVFTLVAGFCAYVGYRRIFYISL